MCISRFYITSVISYFPKTLCTVDKLIYIAMTLLMHKQTGDAPLEHLPLIIAFCLYRNTFLEDSSDGKNRTIGGAGYDNTCFGCRCMHDLTVACVNSHMTGITDDITGLCVFQTIHRRTHTSVCRRRMGQIGRAHV